MDRTLFELLSAFKRCAEYTKDAAAHASIHAVTMQRRLESMEKLILDYAVINGQEAETRDEIARILKRSPHTERKNE